MMMMMMNERKHNFCLYTAVQNALILDARMSGSVFIFKHLKAALQMKKEEEEDEEGEEGGSHSLPTQLIDLFTFCPHGSCFMSAL